MDNDRERELAAAEREAYDEVGYEQRPAERRRRGMGPVVAVAVAVLVLAISAAAGWGLAQLVARVATVSPPAVTVSPPPPVTPSPSVAPATASPSPVPSASAEPATPSAIASQAIHVVQRGEYLSQIAARYGVTTEAIAEANGIENPNLIEPGQRLIIPPRP